MDPEMPYLVELDDNDEEIPSAVMQPRNVDVRAHAASWYDNAKTVKDGDKLLPFSDKIWYVQDNMIHDLDNSKRGPHSPTQRVSEQQAILPM